MNQPQDLQSFLLTVLDVFVSIKETLLYDQKTGMKSLGNNPLNQFGRKCFSQTDEDGITLEIIKRLGIDKGFFIEFGVQGGLETNTLILAALKWRGFWVGNEELSFNYQPTKRFQYVRDWVTLENILGIVRYGLDKFNQKEVDVVSMDLDGNDIYFIRKLLENNILPKLFIAEYNAKFPPPVEFKIKYDPNHTWRFDDYFGASLTSLNDLFTEFGYQLVCCNSYTGANAFFVKKEFMSAFEDVPKDIADIYIEPRYDVPKQLGHPASTKVVETIIEDL